jgi:hypothetical protein
MSTASSKPPGDSGTEAAQPFPRERQAFRGLLLSNPNYFGNEPQTKLEPVLQIAGNTFYETLGCLGYHPQLERLAAVVYINQPSGYGGDICADGTPEYVRFYLSFDNGATWVDQGLASFQAHDVPEGTSGRRRLEFAVQRQIDLRGRLCFLDPKIRARAILSWNNPPPPNQPNWPPVWGNVVNTTIFMEPRRFFPPFDLFQAVDLKIPDQLAQVLDPDEVIKLKAPALGAAELAELYKGEEVPAHRFAFKEISQFVTSKTPLSAVDFSQLLPGIKIDPNITDLIFPKTDGDISFEELRCIGLDPNAPDTLVGIIRLKKSSGFSGGPCTDGSREYVTFWADFDGDGTLETCLGTASVRVYDLPNIPAGGVDVSVHLPVDLSLHRQRCELGPKVVRVRAILSWQSVPPCANPNHVPTWGNREETLVLITPGEAAVPGKIAILGGIPTSMINDFTGQTTFDAVFATNNTPPDNLGRPCPFGGIVTVQGAPPAALAGHTYKIEVKPLIGGVWSPVLNIIVVTDSNGDTSVHTADPITQRFDYLPFNENVNGLLGRWFSGGDDIWLVRLSVYSGGGFLLGTDTHRIQLDNTAPDVSIEITSGGGNCGKFGIGTPISGNFVARDLYMGRYTLAIEPAVNDPGEAIPVPSSGLVNTALAPGDPWSLVTTGMIACGYVIRLVAIDRAILNSQSVGHQPHDSAGFCLE